MNSTAVLLGDFKVFRKPLLSRNDIWFVWPKATLRISIDYIKQVLLF